MAAALQRDAAAVLASSPLGPCARFTALASAASAASATEAVAASNAARGRVDVVSLLLRNMTRDKRRESRQLEVRERR